MTVIWSNEFHEMGSFRERLRLRHLIVYSFSLRKHKKRSFMIANLTRFQSSLPSAYLKILLPLKTEKDLLPR